MAETKPMFQKLFSEKGFPEVEEFTLLPCYYDELMKDVPYRLWVRYIIELLQRIDANFQFQRVLELACGTGNVALEFARRGLEVVGVDISEDMVKVAKEKATKLDLTYQTRFYTQDISELDLPNELPFDLAVCVFDSLNYITDPQKLARVFVRTIRHVRTGGYFVFDMNTEYALSANLFDQDNLDENEAKLYYFWRSHYDEPAKLCRIDMWFAVRDEQGDYKRFKETHWQRVYSIDEVRMMAEVAGWEWVKVLDAYEFHPPQEESERWYFVVRCPINR